ncbi:MAG: hypothetical protein L3J36_14310 [Rhodobacteraceae bacterium]|nr:hypothetical protein [Paracoccaceae bacterium]
MKQILIPVALVALAALMTLPVTLPTSAAAAECYADYKAKKDNPLKLHYGIVQLQGPCERGPAKAEVSARIGAGGWKLLNIISVFGPEGLTQRRGNAGRFFLRF